MLGSSEGYEEFLWLVRVDLRVLGQVARVFRCDLIVVVVVAITGWAKLAIEHLQDQGAEGKHRLRCRHHDQVGHDDLLVGIKGRVSSPSPD